jgi:hypothetical protein
LLKEGKSRGRGRFDGLRQRLGDAMWITHLFPLICRKQRKTHGAVIHSREVKVTG